MITDFFAPCCQDAPQLPAGGRRLTSAPSSPPLLPQGEKGAKQSTMPPHSLYQVLSSSARTAATLAPSVMLTRPSSEVPMFTPWGTMPPHSLYQALSSNALTAATLAPSVMLTRPSSEVPMFTPWGTMPPHSLYQALSSSARTAATLAPSVMLTRPSSEVPMLTSQRAAPWRHTACIRPCPATPAPLRPWRRR